jgi:hypothetical protein
MAILKTAKAVDLELIFQLGKNQHQNLRADGIELKDDVEYMLLQTTLTGLAIAKKVSEKLFKNCS